MGPTFDDQALTESAARARADSWAALWALENTIQEISNAARTMRRELEAAGPEPSPTLRHDDAATMASLRYTVADVTALFAAEADAVRTAWRAQRDGGSDA